MDAPPEHEDIGPFLTVAGHLLDRGFHPPRPLAIDRERGLLLLEDFGDDRVGPLLQREPHRERDDLRGGGRHPRAPRRPAGTAGSAAL